MYGTKTIKTLSMGVTNLQKLTEILFHDFLNLPQKCVICNVVKDNTEMSIFMIISTLNIIFDMPIRMCRLKHKYFIIFKDVTSKGLNMEKESGG